MSELRKYITAQGFTDREYNLLKPLVIQLSLLIQQTGLTNEMASQLYEALAKYHTEVPKKLEALQMLQHMPEFSEEKAH